MFIREDDYFLIGEIMEKDDKNVPPTDLGEQPNPPGRAQILKGKIELHTIVEINLEGDPTLVNKTYEILARTSATAHKRAVERVGGQESTEIYEDDPNGIFTFYMVRAEKVEDLERLSKGPLPNHTGEKLPCGTVCNVGRAAIQASIKAAQEIPCPCGNPNHWILKIEIG